MIRHNIEEIHRENQNITEGSGLTDTGNNSFTNQNICQNNDEISTNV